MLRRQVGCPPEFSNKDRLAAFEGIYEKFLFPHLFDLAEQARSTITGRRMNTNGWSFWQFDSGSGKLRTLEEVRTAYLATRPQT